MVATTGAHAAEIRWRSQTVHVKVESKDIKDVLRDLASGQNVPATVATNVTGTVTGDFNMPPQRFLDSLASTFGFVWFYDGTVLAITNANDMSRQIVKLNVAGTGDLARTLAQMRLDSPQFPITYDDNHGTALVSGPPQYVALVGEVARQLDDTMARRAGSTIRIYHLKHAWAEDHKVTIDGTTIALPGVAATLDSMFHGRANSNGGGSAAKGSQGGMQRLPSMPDVGGGTSGGGFAGGGASGGVMPPLPSGGLTNGSATVPRIVADPVNTMTEMIGGRNRGGGGGGGSGAGEEVDRELPVIVADQRTNSILIRDLTSRMPQYGPLIDQLDVKPQLIELEAHVIEVENTALKQLGVEWRAHNSHVDLQTGNGSTTANSYSNGVLNPTFSGSLSNDGGTTTINTTPLGGSLTAVLGDAGRYLLTRINALEQTNQAKIDSSPKIATLDNVEAQMNNDTKFFVRVASYTAADLYSVQTGTDLRVLPMLIDGNGSRQIKLAVHITDGQLTGQQVDNIPVITSSNIDTEALLNEGDALLIAGYRVSKATHLQNGVPGLSKIPLIGGLFKYRDDEDSNMERLFLITPRVINLDYAAARQPLASAAPTPLPPMPPAPQRPAMAPPGQPVTARQAQSSVAVEQRLQDWADAWMSHDADRYLTFYDADFKPQKGSKAGWVADRRRMLGKKEPIDVKLSNVQSHALTDSRVETSFEQTYSSKGFKDTVHKTLIWDRVGTEWKIVGEGRA
ncbi:MAG: type III secretion system outer membrane ring subunit SctC [Burkholderiaceae bacterium]